MAGTHIEQAQSLIAAGKVEAATALLERAAAAGDAVAAMCLATWRLIGAPLPRDLPAARRSLRRAVEIGHVDAALMEVALTANGSGAPPDWRAARALLDIAATRDPVAADHCALLDAMALDGDGNPRALPEPERLNDDPRVLRYRSLLTPAECAHIARAGAELLEPARVFDPRTGRQVAHPVRSSDGGTIGPTRETLPIQAITRRLAAASGTRADAGEPLVVLRYAPGQEYRLHHDAITGAANPRIVTVLAYLNGGFAGGETDFPDLGLRIVPQGGDVVVFDNLRDDGTPNPHARHAGMPVRSGSKWLATRWVRARALDPWNPV